MANEYNHNTLAVIIPFDDMNAFEQLSYCLFALSGQQYQQIALIIITKNFSPSAISKITKLVESFIWPQASQQQVINTDIVTDDHNDVNFFNQAISLAADYHYFTFLGYQDSMLPEAYIELVNALNRSKAALALCAYDVKVVIPAAACDIQKGIKRSQLKETDGVKHLQSDDIPACTLVFDRSKINDNDLVIPAASNIPAMNSFQQHIGEKYGAEASCLDRSLFFHATYSNKYRRGSSLSR